jgi:hypothetical protein
MFYIVVIPPIYWCFNKKFGFRLLIISSFAAYISTVVKNLTRLPRPAAQSWKSLDGTYAFPSGHAQGSTTFWLYIMSYIRHFIIIILGFVVITLVAISRIYLGVHYPGDVFAGIALGVATVAIFLFFEPKITRMLSSWSFENKLLLGTVIPLLLFFYASLFHSVDPRGVKLAGALFGMFIGYLLEEEYLRFSVVAPLENKIFRIFFGLFIAYLAYFGLGFALPQNIATCFFTAWLGGFTVTYIAPWVFKKIEKKSFMVEKNNLI